MIDRTRICLNRIISPGLNLEEFFQLAADLDLSKIELRNDLPGFGVIDPYSPEQVEELTETYGIQIIAINALQNFNVSSLLPLLMEGLQELITLSVALDCRAIVLCPRHHINDTRSPEKCFKETVNVLREFAPFLRKSDLVGYIEPLGFEDSSLSSLVIAMKAIQASGCHRYKIVYDTFHHHLGPDTMESLENEYDVTYTGLVHVSGVESDISANQYRDAHRVLVSPADQLKSREQIEKLIALGYEGVISFEPFAEELQQLEPEDLKAALSESIEYFLGE